MMNFKEEVISRNLLKIEAILVMKQSNLKNNFDICLTSDLQQQIAKQSKIWCYKKLRNRNI